MTEPLNFKSLDRFVIADRGRAFVVALPDGVEALSLKGSDVVIDGTPRHVIGIELPVRVIGGERMTALLCSMSKGDTP